MNNIFRSQLARSTWLAALFSFGLTACGGGGGGSDTGGAGGAGGAGDTGDTGDTVNQAPSADAGADLATDEGTGFSLAGAGEDPDGEVSFAWTVPDGFTVTGQDSATLNITGTPDVTADQAFTFTLTVTDDNGASASDDVNVTVKFVSQAPNADAGTDLATDEGTSFSLVGAGDDPDGDTITYAWTVPAGFTATGQDSATLNITDTPDVTANTTFAFTLKVTDAHGADTTDSVDVTLQARLDLAVSISDIKTLRFTWTPVDGDHYRIAENPDGVSGFSDLDSINGDANAYHLDIPVHLLDWTNASYLIEACADAECTTSKPSNTVSVAELVVNEAIGFVKASNTDTEDRFGTAVALSADGKTLAIGAINEDSAATGIDGNQADNTFSSAGAVYVFRHANHDDDTSTPDTWVQDAYIKASNTNLADRFGTAVALSADGNTLAVGATGEDSAATGIDGDHTNNSDSAFNSGAVYVFRHDGTAWAQEAYVKASNTEALDEFGRAIALSADGSTLAVSAPREDSAATDINQNQNNNNANDAAGAVYVFRHDGTVWAQEAYVKASNTDSDYFFGYSVALSADGNTLAVGALFEDGAATGINGNQADSSANDAGAVYVFRHDGTAWGQQAYVKASNTEAGDRFGYPVALSADGDTLAVGAAGEDSAATGIDGDQTDNSADSAGAVYVFRHDGTTWAQEAYVKASNTEKDDLFGNAVALSADGNSLAVGATNEASAATGIDDNQTDNSAVDAGAVYMFRHDGTTWAQQAYVKASNTEASDRFSDAVALSGDGKTLAVGATNEDSAATNIDSNQADNSSGSSGAVYIY